MNRRPPLSMEETAHVARLTCQQASYDGTGTIQNRIYINACRHIFMHNPELVASVLFTRDANMHSMGWWKNPEYDRCYHLSLCFQTDSGPVPHDQRLAKQWCELLFRENTRYLWVESPKSSHGKRLDVWHYRCFMQPDWRTPILPRGEVYSRELTEAGWKSWSDQWGDEVRLLDPKEQP